MDLVGRRKKKAIPSQYNFLFGLYGTVSVHVFMKHWTKFSRMNKH